MSRIINFYVTSCNGVDILEFLRKEGYSFEKDNNYDVENAITYAAGVGNLRVLEWFEKMGCKFDFRHSFDMDVALECAARKGHINVLEWFEKMGYDFKRKDSKFKMAAEYATGTENSHSFVQEWLENNN